MDELQEEHYDEEPQDDEGPDGEFQPQDYEE
jgi:hypothetical protein